MLRLKLVLVMVAALACAQAADRKKRGQEPSAVDRWLEESAARVEQTPPPAPGSLWQPGAQLGGLGRDLRAAQIDDLVTIVVAESASALSSGTVKTQRDSSASASVGSLGHKFGAGSALSNLANLSGSTKLDGQGSTGRQTVLTAFISARVTRVMTNGYLVVEGKKTVQVNSEQQIVSIRGVVRPVDLAQDNSIESNRVAQMEIGVNGKGVVNDAIRRPMFLYRLLTGLLPF